jgi:hypothetical protein
MQYLSGLLAFSNKRNLGFAAAKNMLAMRRSSS